MNNNNDIFQFLDDKKDKRDHIDKIVSYIYEKHCGIKRENKFQFMWSGSTIEIKGKLEIA